MTTNNKRVEMRLRSGCNVERRVFSSFSVILHLNRPASLTDNDEVDFPRLVHGYETVRIVFAAGCLQTVGQKSILCRIRMNDQIVTCIVVR
jgi:hypothetical protein